MKTGPLITLSLLLSLGWGSALWGQEVQTLASGGASEDRVDLVILAEGYTRAEAARFEADARGVVEAIRSHGLYGRYKRFFNVHAVFSPAQASGILPRSGGPDTTLFGTRQRGGTMVSADWARVQRAALRAPDVDKMIVFCNTEQDIGMRSGNVVFVSRVDTADTILHELGHTLANLADEYVRSSGRSAREAARDLEADPRPNVASRHQLQALPWERWVEPGTPVPARAGTKGVSAWEGGFTATEGVYRPREAGCRMRYFRNGPFCEPCREALVLSLHAMTSPTQVEEERSSSASLFRVQSAVPEATRRVEWSLEGDPPSAALRALLREASRQNQVRLRVPDAFLTGSQRLRVVVRDATPWVRARALEAGFSFPLGGPRETSPEASPEGAGPRPGLKGALEGSW